MVEEIKEKAMSLYDTGKNIMFIVGVAAFFASPIIAVTIAAQTGKEAKRIANKALSMAELNSRDFAFFKGEVNAKLDIILKNGDAQLLFMNSIEGVPNDSASY